MIPEAVMRELRYIEVATARKIRNQRVGTYQSPLRGPGFDFDEHQPYQPGDDVRRIDWNVTARMNAPFVKRYVEERELTVVLVVDASLSMRFGTGEQTKRAVVAEAAAVLAVCAAGNNDRVGFFSYRCR